MAKQTSISIFAFGLIIAAFAGCDSGTSQPAQFAPLPGKNPVAAEMAPAFRPPPSGDSAGDGDAASADADNQADSAAPEKTAMPDVVLTEAQAGTCVVSVGDQLPEGSLKDLTGADQSLADLLGRVTVVLMWNAADLHAVPALEDMQLDIVDKFPGEGVNVVAINHKDPPELAEKAVKDSGAKFPVLLDRDGAYFSQLATEGSPRILLVDRRGKILWFDIEYSRTTRTHLEQAILSALGA